MIRQNELMNVRCSERGSLLGIKIYSPSSECLIECVDIAEQILITLKKIHNYLSCQVCNSLREQGLPIRSSPANKHLRITSIEDHKVFHKKLPLCQKRKIPIKSKENMKVKNIPMADLSCSSPLPSADQVEIYVPHK